MRKSWPIGTVAGIALKVHPTFFLLLGWVALMQAVQGHSLGMVLQGVGFILALFGCVVLHELGHAVTAREFGIKTRDITLLPIGGVARLEGEMPSKPLQEFWIALAGPAVNLVIAAILWASLVLTSSPWDGLAGLDPVHGAFAARLMVLNLFLAGFNMLPAFPMDGGRVLRSLLATRMSRVRATQVAAELGQTFAYFFGFLGILTNPFLVLLAVFVWMGAAQEAAAVQVHSVLEGVTVERAMASRFQTLRPEDRLDRAVEVLLGGFQHDFPVVSEGRVVGVLTRHDLLGALAQRGAQSSVEQVMQRDFRTVQADQMLEAALQKLDPRFPCRTVPVLKDEDLVGLLTTENLGEFLMVQTARTQNGPRAIPKGGEHATV